MSNAEHVSVDHITLEMLQEGFAHFFSISCSIVLHKPLWHGGAGLYLEPRNACTHCLVFDHYLAHYQRLLICSRACRDVSVLFRGVSLLNSWMEQSVALKELLLSDRDSVSRKSLHVLLCYRVSLSLVLHWNFHHCLEKTVNDWWNYNVMLIPEVGRGEGRKRIEK